MDEYLDSEKAESGNAIWSPDFSADYLIVSVELTMGNESNVSIVHSMIPPGPARSLHRRRYRCLIRPAGKHGVGTESGTAVVVLPTVQL